LTPARNKKTMNKESLVLHGYNILKNHADLKQKLILNKNKILYA